MTNEERELSIEYLEKIKEDYIDCYGDEKCPLPEYYAIESAIKALEQKIGHWVDDEVDSFSKSFGYKKFHCSRCLKVIEGSKAEKTDYCPNCGADMREEV